MRASYLIGADGRSSIVRKRLNPVVHRRADPLDVVWFKVSYPEGWPDSYKLLGSFSKKLREN